jgi:sugar O-acyltransferase (sialic acid O-acetyltransferase NeuD family)
VIELSVVCAVYNEGEGVDELVDALAAVLPAITEHHEIIIVDDGSADDTLDRLKIRAKNLPALRVVELARNFGQVGALGAGLTIARGAKIVTMDGDLQHDPSDIPRLYEAGRDGRHDLVATWRARRAEPMRRRMVTFIGNRVNRLLTGLDVRDFGSTFRVIDARIIDALRDRDGRVHYNTPALYANARRLLNLPIEQKARPFGASKWTLAMFVAYNLDFVTASPRLLHLLFIFSFVGFALAIGLLMLALIFGMTVIGPIFSAGIAALCSAQLAMLGVVWWEILRAQKFAKGGRGAMKKIAIVGGRPDGHGKVVIELAREIPGIEVVGFLDDAPKSKLVSGAAWLGGTADRADSLIKDGIELHIAIGHNVIRRRLALELGKRGAKFATLIHPSAQVYASATIGEGSLIVARAIVGPGVVVGAQVIVNHGAILDHDTRLDDYVNVSTGFKCGGRVRFHEGVFAGVGVIAIPDSIVHRWSYLGAGAVVTEELAAHGLYIGVPAKKLRSLGNDDEPLSP